MPFKFLGKKQSGKGSDPGTAWPFSRETASFQRKKEFLNASCR
jgi:hypothetical protein